MWFLRRRVRIENLPESRVVVRFDFGESGPRSYWLEDQQSFWLVLEQPEAELCLSDPGFEVDLIVRAELAALTSVYLGRLSLAAALSARSVELAGPTALRRAFPSWLGISPFAEPHAPPRRRRLGTA